MEVPGPLQQLGDSGVQESTGTGQVPEPLQGEGEGLPRVGGLGASEVPCAAFSEEDTGPGRERDLFKVTQCVTTLAPRLPLIFLPIHSFTKYALCAWWWE